LREFHAECVSFTHPQLLAFTKRAKKGVFQVGTRFALKKSGEVITHNRHKETPAITNS
jgi:hypothetical protein